MLADEILQKARRILRLEQLRDRTLVKLDREKREYYALIANLQGRKPYLPASEAPTKSALRSRILKMLEDIQEGRDASLATIHEATGEPRDKVIWTLANLKRSGHVLNPKRGFWRINPDGKEGPLGVHEGREADDTGTDPF